MSARGLASWVRPWILGVVAGACVQAGAAPAPETELKAAFIFHFTQFIEWPARAFDGADASFVIGVLGNEPVAEALAEIVRGERQRGHPIEVRRLEFPSDADGCQIVYVSAKDESTFRAARFRGQPVLTVGETEGFLPSGGMIEFFTDQRHLKLRINLPAAKAASLQVSSQLLRVAEVFGSK